VIYVFLVTSLFLNAAFAWFIFKSLVRHSDLVALVEDLEYKIDYFRQHLEGLYELPMFYGEPTIQNLIDHSKLLLTSFEQFNQEYDVFNEEEIVEEENDLQAQA
jgi:hypothetical protein